MLVLMAGKLSYLARLEEAVSREKPPLLYALKNKN